MTIAELVKPVLLDKVRFTYLPEHYEISMPELFVRCLQLAIQPIEVDGILYVDAAQLAELDDLHVSLQPREESLPIAYDVGETYLYRCTHCGELWLTDTPLHERREHLRLCDGGHSGSSLHVGTFEFIGSGPYKEIVSLARSWATGLLDPMKGI